MNVSNGNKCKEKKARVNAPYALFMPNKWSTTILKLNFKEGKKYHLTKQSTPNSNTRIL